MVFRERKREHTVDVRETLMGYLPCPPRDCTRSLSVLRAMPQQLSHLARARPACSPST